jgi:hypothetical protein
MGLRRLLKGTYRGAWRTSGTINAIYLPQKISGAAPRPDHREIEGPDSAYVLFTSTDSEQEP